MKVSEYQWPEWAIWLQALGPLAVGIGSLVVGLAVGVIAYRQWRTAKDKLISDLFDRRSAVYSKALDAIYEVMANGGDPEGKAIRAARAAAGEAEFLFGREVNEKLQHLVFLIKMTWKLKDQVNPDGTPDEQMVDARNGAVETIITMQNELSNIFRPYMKMDRKI